MQLREAESSKKQYKSKNIVEIPITSILRSPAEGTNSKEPTT
jgi:hypothetical protein